MNKPTLNNNKPTKEEQYEHALNVISIATAVVCAILVVELAGIIFLKIFQYPIHGFIYNFIFGFGVLTGVAFLCALFQEIFEK